MKNIDNFFGDFFGAVPILSTAAGRSLTTKNWQETNVRAVSFYLAELLMKPGYDYLMTLPDLATFVGWPACLVLNATLPSINGQGLFALRSHYDGRRIEHTVEEILALISKLQPTIAILPPGVWHKKELCESLPESIFVFAPETDVRELKDTTRPFGVYVSYDELTMSPTELGQQLARYRGLPRYVTGEFSLSLMRELIKNGIQFIETNLPAADACQGNVNCSDGVLALSDGINEKQVGVIDEACHCPVCSLRLSRAYLHHLLQHTPLLCQRFLVQHNVFYIQSQLDSQLL